MKSSEKLWGTGRASGCNGNLPDSEADACNRPRCGAPAAPVLTGRQRRLSGFRLEVDGGYFLRAVTGRLGECCRPSPASASSESVWTVTGALVRAPRRDAIPRRPLTLRQRSQRHHGPGFRSVTGHRPARSPHLYRQPRPLHGSQAAAQRPRHGAHAFAGRETPPYLAVPRLGLLEQLQGVPEVLQPIGDADRHGRRPPTRPVTH